jgi:hypothetical protein
LQQAIFIEQQSLASAFAVLTGASPCAVKRRPIDTTSPERIFNMTYKLL